MTRTRVLRALCRFDAANVEEIAAACGCNNVQARSHLRGLVKDGYAEQLGSNYVRYVPTETGRHVARSAA